MTYHDKKFEESLIAGVAFVCVYTGLMAAGFVILGSVFGIVGALCLVGSIYHVCADIWRDGK